MVVRELVRRVVRGVVRRVVRGVGSVGSPRSGGQFFQLSLLASPYTMNRSNRFICFSLIIDLSFLHYFNSSMSSLLGAFD